MIPRRMFEELGQAAARYNTNAARHGSGCCTICRRALVGIFQALMDPENWKPEDPRETMMRLQEEMEMVKQRLAATAPFQPPPEPAFEEPTEPVEPPGLQPFPPPFSESDE